MVSLEGYMCALNLFRYTGSTWRYLSLQRMVYRGSLGIRWNAVDHGSICYQENDGLG